MILVTIIIWRGLSIYFANNITGKEDELPLIEITDQEIYINGVTVHYTTAGDINDQPLLLLQGIGGPFTTGNANNQKMLSVLSQDFFVYAPEHPGHRRSAVPQEPWDYEDYKRYIVEFVEQLNIKNPTIVGQSFGGKLAQVYAIDHADDIRLLVIGDASTSFNDPTLFEKVMPHLVPLGSWLLKSDSVPLLIKRQIIRHTFSIPDNLVDTANLAKYAVTMDRSYSLGPFYSDQLDKITTPTIIVWGEKDLQFPPDQGRKLNDLLPNSKLYIYEGAGHTAMYQQPDRTLSLINQALSGL